MEKCPACGKYCVVYEEYYGRKVCLMRQCGWSELSTPKKDGREQLDNDRYDEDILPFISYPYNIDNNNQTIKPLLE